MSGVAVRLVVNGAVDGILIGTDYSGLNGQQLLEKMRKKMGDNFPAFRERLVAGCVNPHNTERFEGFCVRFEDEFARHGIGRDGMKAVLRYLCKRRCAINSRDGKLEARLERSFSGRRAPN